MNNTSCAYLFKSMIFDEKHQSSVDSHVREIK